MSHIIEQFADGTVIERDLTEKELAQIEADRLDFELKQELKREAEAKRQSALAKLEALGLDEDDLKALGL